MTETNNTTIFTDGATRKNNKNIPNIGSWSFVVYHNKKIIVESSKVAVNTTNNRMELAGICNSLKWITEQTELVKFSIYTDSEISYKTFRGITLKDGDINHGASWIGGWLKRGINTGEMLKANNKTPSNNEKVTEIYNLLIEILRNDKTVTFYHVNSHTGKTDDLSLGNQKADQLCNAAIDNYITITKNL